MSHLDRLVPLLPLERLDLIRERPLLRPRIDHTRLDKLEQLPWDVRIIHEPTHNTKILLDHLTIRNRDFTRDTTHEYHTSLDSQRAEDRLEVRDGLGGEGHLHGRHVEEDVCSGAVGRQCEEVRDDGGGVGRHGVGPDAGLKVRWIGEEPGSELVCAAAEGDDAPGAQREGQFDGGIGEPMGIGKLGAERDDRKYRGRSVKEGENDGIENHAKE